MNAPALAAPASPLRRAGGLVLLRLALVIAAPIVMTTAACGGEAPATKSSDPAKTPESADKDAAPASATASALPFVASYLTIQETLADDSIDKLAELAAAVVTGAEASADKPGVAEVLAGAGRVPAQDIETARVGFEKMSMGLISFLKANPAQQAGLEVIFCPMAFNNKGAYWVQKKGAVTNPYHGKMMLRCGDAVEWAKAPG